MATPRNDGVSTLDLSNAGAATRASVGHLGLALTMRSPVVLSRPRRAIAADEPRCCRLYYAKENRAHIPTPSQDAQDGPRLHSGRKARERRVGSKERSLLVEDLSLRSFDLQASKQNEVVAA